jgi:hypothetical protein
MVLGPIGDDGELEIIRIVAQIQMGPRIDRVDRDPERLRTGFGGLRRRRESSHRQPP